MLDARVLVLLFITVLELCQTEISNAIPEWYSANVINDGGFSPKPLTEIFSTDRTFSTNNPIVVLPYSSQSPSANNTPVSTSTSQSSFIPSSVDPLPPVPVVPLSTSSQPAITQRTEVTPTPQQTTAVSTEPTTIQSETLQSEAQTVSVQTTQPQTIVSQQTPSILQTLPPLVPIPLQPVQSQTNQQNAQPNPLPNYFVFYQQAPQSIQNYPSGNQQPQLLQPVSAIPPVQILMPNITRPAIGPCNVTNINPTPNGGPNSPVSNAFPSFRIRMVSPMGSVTNVRVNMPISTTSRPTTTRRIRNRNNYDGCVDSCVGQRQPLCASPSGVTPIDPDTLRGFPSICHMACHNSFRRNAYQKVADGKCGRLRTRIRPFDSNTKLTKGQLNQAQYTLFQSGPQTLVEFQPLNK